MITHELDGLKVKKLRSNNGWRRSEVAKQLKVSRLEVARFEQPICNVTKEELFAICTLYDVKPHDIIFGNDPHSQARKLQAIEKVFIDQRRLKLANKKGKVFTESSTQKKKRKKHKPKSISCKLIISSGFETNRRRH